jgi:hypothetical protein
MNDVNVTEYSVRLAFSAFRGEPLDRIAADFGGGGPSDASVKKNVQKPDLKLQEQRLVPPLSPRLKKIKIKI